MLTSRNLNPLGVSILLACLALALTGATSPPPGSLDSTFGSNGIVEATFPGVDSNAYALAIQPDGKIVAGGGTSDSNPAKVDLALARYLSDGSLDSTFGVDGRMTTDFSGNCDDASAILLQPDGKILVAGSAYDGSDYDFALARYDSAGNLDTSFGAGGKVVTDLDGGQDYGNALILQPDGKIVVAGWAEVGSDYNFALARYASDGSLDSSFGSGGKVITHFGDGESLANAAVLQPDGKILVAGAAFDSDTDTRKEEFALARYTSDGSLDPTFGAGGKVTSDFGDQHNNAANAMVLQPDGKIIVGGTTYLYNYDIAVVRYTGDGSLDATFGSGGRTIVRFETSSNESAIALQADGKIVVTGNTLSSTGRSIFAIARLQTDGSLDSIFGNDGLVTTPIDDRDAAPTAIGLQADGKILLSGIISYLSGDPHFLLARYNAADWQAYLPLAMK